MRLVCSVGLDYPATVLPATGTTDRQTDTGRGGQGEKRHGKEEAGTPHSSSLFGVTATRPITEDRLTKEKCGEFNPGHGGF